MNSKAPDSKPLRDVLAAAEAGNDALLPLLKDVFHFHVSAARSPVQRRAYVRALFSLVEAWTFTMKQICLTYHGMKRCKFQLAELAVLEEEQYGIGEDGSPDPRPWFIQTERNFKFICKAYAKATGSTYEVDLGGSGWGAFTEAVKIRNRLTHPKRVSDLEVSEKEFSTVQKAEDFFYEVLMNMAKTLVSKPPLSGDSPSLDIRRP